MFLRSTICRKDGKEHRYWSLVENRRVSGGRVVQRHVLYLGEINARRNWRGASRSRFWMRAASEPRTLALFPEDRCEGVLPDASIVRLKLSQLRLCRPRQWGACWLALKLWEELGLDRFWAERLPPEPQGHALGSGAVGAGGLSADRAGSEWRLHRRLVRAQRAWRTCSARIRRWPTSTSSIAATTGCSSTSRRCSITWSGAGGICSTPPSTCCCTISPAPISRPTRHSRRATSAASATRAIIGPTACRWSSRWW